MSAIQSHPEFVSEWDVLRDENGDAITYGVLWQHAFGEAVVCDRTADAVPPTELQLAAIRRAVEVWSLVCQAEGSPQAMNAWDEVRGQEGRGRYDWNHPNMSKSRLLGRMIHEGLPPTRTKPPTETAGPAWWLLPGGDPFDGPTGPTQGPFLITIVSDGMAHPMPGESK